MSQEFAIPTKIHLKPKYPIKKISMREYNKWWFQLIIWAVVFLIFFSSFNFFQSIGFSLFHAAFDTTSMFLVHLYALNRIKKNYKKDKILSFPVWSVLVILCYAIVITGLKHFILDGHYITGHTVPPFAMLVFMGFIKFGFVLFIDYIIHFANESKDYKIKEKQLREEKLDTELKLLKAQINPHFIFNALNNIYSLTYMKSENAPESVLKLSEMLRYVFYDCSNDNVPLTSEIHYIENFIAFQQMKTRYTQNISMQIDLKAGNPQIAPMLYIPFIENAFKYSRIEEVEDSYVNIIIKEDPGKVVFIIRNSIPEKNKPLPGSGMGIKNVKHRLKIIYPGTHTLTTNESNDEFNLKLCIEINHNCHINT